MPLGARLRVTGIDFSYGSVQVLHDVSLDVAPGEMVALLGTNGAGKSTLLRVVSGLSRPSAGRVELDGADVTRADPVDLVGRGVVLLQGGKAVFADLTVAENLHVGAWTLRRNRQLVQERSEAVLDLFPALKARLGQRAGSLSGGEQQQLALAKAMLLSPRALLIDELSLGLAPVVVEALLDRVRAVNATGTTVVLVEQSLNVAAGLCERAVFMEKGAVRFEGRTVDLLERSDIARAVFFGGETAP
ncbi:MAG TPA: ABC transporter ATP-binding protein [Acidimicrobiales bacterium]|nr:ABC transporter ATP-binding protein [Acidimicrobiales bacterium]